MKVITNRIRMFLFGLSIAFWGIVDPIGAASAAKKALENY